jgi:hypothetical protein
MVCVPLNIKEFCSTRETSHEIGLAIFQLADKGDEVRMWSDPTDDEEDKIIERAWKRRRGRALIQRA